MAASAGYSRRTFANHFSCKEEAVASVATAHIGDALAEFDATPVEGSLVDVLELVVRSQVSWDVVERAMRLDALVAQHPSLTPFVLASHRSLMEAGIAVVRRLAGDAYDDLHWLLLVNACYGAMGVMLSGKVTLRRDEDPPAEGTLTLADFVSQVFAYLRHGF